MSSVKPLTRVSFFLGVNFVINISQSVDMSAEMASETIEVITMAVDKHQQTKNYEVCSIYYFIDVAQLMVFQAAAQLIKTSLDKKFGAAWHCVIGEGFGFDMTYQAKNMLYMYYGTIGILAYKC